MGSVRPITASCLMDIAVGKGLDTLTLQVHALFMSINVEAICSVYSA